MGNQLIFSFWGKSQVRVFGRQAPPSPPPVPQPPPSDSRSDGREKSKKKGRTSSASSVAAPSAAVVKVEAATVEDVGTANQGKQKEHQQNHRHDQQRKRRARNLPRHLYGEQVVAGGWPSWLSMVAGEAIKGWTPRRADTFEKLDKIGQGTYSNVYKARDMISGKIVALKKLEGLVTSRMSCSLYLVFEYMEHDLAGLAASPGIKFTEPQVKCYMKQLLSGLEHCHNNGVLHRDIKGSNLLLDNSGVLKIADFGLAANFDPNRKQPMTSRVVTLWYRPPELLLGATDYGVGVDLWSAVFTMKPYACEPSSLPQYPPSKEMDAKLRDEEARRLRAAGGKNGEGAKKTRTRERPVRAVPAPEANAELQANLDRRRLITHANAKSKSEKFPPPHQDGALGYPLGSSHHMDPPFEPPQDASFTTIFPHPKGQISTWSGPLVDSATAAPRRKKQSGKDSRSLKQPAPAGANSSKEIHKDKAAVRVR
ncbi:putative serine/threonine-protein kinase [Acorus calamus]|uniref:[RNA-polymerase]-subunit kinase n=1 Tax=Acorus calamus TaxID=4465 RepID=A0AAV9ERE8_ACOCL|nr:putative serine/threonine-protein kinase [Acorus calamus]